MAKQKIIRVPKVPDVIKSSLVSTAGALLKRSKGPDELLGELLSDVQRQRIYDDGKTFVDLVPKSRIRTIQAEYRLLKKDPHFDLHEFVSSHFYDLTTTTHKKEPFVYDEHRSIDQHIETLWDFLERRNRISRGSLVALPYSYVVPGGRFNEQFYWDSYFIMLGLSSGGHHKMVEGMVKNYAFMIRKYGFIPTANRSYFLSRSQPPFFVEMIEMLQKQRGASALLEYLPYLLSEYRFWMKGRSKLAKEEHKAFARVVQLPGGVLANRYYDNKETPRPESLREDVETADASVEREADRLYLHLRAAAESGWDFSSRWFMDPQDLKTIHTVDITPVDLNSLLYLLEMKLAHAYKLLLQPLVAKRYRLLAERRKRAINKYMWDEEQGFFVDYNFHHGQPTGILSLAGVFPLYAGIATNEQAKRVAEIIEKDFLKPGGLVTTLVNNGQQWDAPNGWAPLQWIAIKGLRKYGFNELADEIKKRWMTLNENVFARTHKMVEKYNVENADGLGGGGEYPLQDGFGWTNGVYEALKNEE